MFFWLKEGESIFSRRAQAALLSFSHPRLMFYFNLPCEIYVSLERRSAVDLCSYYQFKELIFFTSQYTLIPKLILHHNKQQNYSDVSH